jgi:hypothetical protein
MRSILLSWCVLSALALVGLAASAAHGKDEPKSPRKERITVMKGLAEGWLHIYPDGSGTIGYGAGGSYQWYFKEGTFDFEKVGKQLRALPLDEKGHWRTHYHFGFSSERKGPEQPGPTYYTSDKKLILSLFEKAIEAGGARKSILFKVDPTSRVLERILTPPGAEK